MLLKKNGIEFSVADVEVSRIVLERLNAPEASGVLIDLPPDALDPGPRIGEAWQGGIYAGVARGRDGASDYHLIVGPEHESDIDWVAAIEWAKGLSIDGWKDYSLPDQEGTGALLRERA
jgi:hypothetical protein